MNHRRVSNIIPYKIKVNKKGSYNNIYKTHNCIVNSSNNTSKKYHINTYTFQSNKSSNNCNNSSIITPYSNNSIINKQAVKCKNISNSEEKIRKNSLNINIFDEKNNKNGCVLEELINNQNLKPIFDSGDNDDKLLNCNLKEPIRNNFNVSLNDFFNRKENYFIDYKTPKIEINKKRKELSIKTQNLNNNNYIHNFNNVNSDITIHNRTLENNYYNDIKMTNNYYNNNKINLLNFQSYNNNFLHFSSEGIKDNSYSENNPLIYYSYERNSNILKNRNNTYLNNKNNNVNNINNNNIIEYTKYNSPIGHYLKNQIYSQKINKGNVDNFTSYKPKKSTYNYKGINIRNIWGNGDIPKFSPNNINKYENIKNVIKENNNIIRQYKYNYNKKLFNIYKGKLINEFVKHMENAIKSYKNKINRYFFDLLLQIKQINKIDEIFIPKVNLCPVGLMKNKKKILRISANLKKQKYSKIFYSEKKFPQKQKYLINSKNINPLNLSQANIGNKLYKKMNNSFMSNKELKKDIIPKNNLIIKEKRDMIPKSKNVNSNNSNNSNSNISVLNRNSIKSSNILNKNKSNKNNNIQIINDNNSLNPYIYKKKITQSKNFENKKNIYSKDINKEDILSNSKGKIIDIDINLGKPVKEISDISPLENVFINNYNNKKYKSSLSTNKRQKKKRNHKIKTKKFSLPKKKYLEEKYDIYPITNEEDEKEDNIFNIKNYSFENNSNKNIINLNNSYNLKHNNNYFKNFMENYDDINNYNKKEKKNYKNILVKNIQTLDKRLFIHINYIYSLYQGEIKKNEKYEQNLLILERNIFFSIINEKPYNKLPNKSLSHNSLFAPINTRNNNNIFKKQNKELELNKTNYMNNTKDKYLYSCVKFIVKNINKVFLNKAYRYFVNKIKERNNKNKKNENNKYKINTYKKKISKNKI